MQITQKIIAAVKSHYQCARKWTGRPGYLGFGLLGLGTFVSGMRDDRGMGLLLVTIIVAFAGEQLRLFHLVKGE